MKHISAVHLSNFNASNFSAFTKRGQAGGQIIANANDSQLTSSSSNSFDRFPHGSPLCESWTGDGIGNRGGDL